MGYTPLTPGPDANGLESSYLGLHYHYQEDDGDTVNVLQLFVANFGYHNVSPNKNDFDRSGTPLGGLSALYSDFFPTDDFRYQQSGAGVNIRLDLSGFSELDTIENLLLHSAELELNGIDGPEGLDPIGRLQLTMTDSTLYQKRISFVGRTFIRTVQLEAGFNPLIPLIDRLGNDSPLALIYDDDDRQYEGNLTSYMQVVINNETRLNQLIIEATSVFRPGSSVNRFRVHQDSIRMKLYYTRPNL